MVETAAEGFCSFALTVEEVAVEAVALRSGFSCSCLVLFGRNCGKLTAEAEVEVVAAVPLLSRRHCHRNGDRDRDCFLLFVSSFSFSDWRELKPKPLLSLSSRWSSFAPIVPSPKVAAASEAPAAVTGSS